MDTRHNPLVGPPPVEVPLERAPLVRVIAQVRFPLVASVEQQNFIAPFQEAIRDAYPVLRPETSQVVLFAPTGGAPEVKQKTSWRFHDPETGWRVTLAPDFVALETQRYTSRDDFMERLRGVLVALKEHVDPRFVDRVGVRYVDRVVGDELQDLSRLVHPEVSGVLGSPLARHIQHALSESVFLLPDDAGKITARWGWVPAGSVLEHSAVGPADEDGWLLDLDASKVFAEGKQRFEVDRVVGLARGFAERTYSLFRWVVTDEFLARYGGKHGS